MAFGDDMDMQTVTTQDNPAPASPGPGASSNDDAQDTPQKITALVTEWNERVSNAIKDHYEKHFKRAKVCMDIARDGAESKYAKNEDNVVVPILNRHINTQVAVLYGKDPKSRAKRKKRLMHTVWDGTQRTLQEAMQAAMQSAALGAQGVPDPATGLPMQPDPQALAIVQDAMQVRNYDVQMDNLGKTLEILFDYFMSEQSAGYRSSFKAQVRRTKVCGWSWVKLGFQRILEPRPEIMAQIDDATSQLAALKRMIGEYQEGQIDDNSAQMAQLEATIQQLTEQKELVVREGPVFDFPKHNQIIVDPDVSHYKTLAGAQWVAHEWDMTPDKIQEIYGVDIGSRYTAYKANGTASKVSATEKKGQLAKVREVWDKAMQQVFTICDGYPDFLKAPGEPDVKIERFYPFFPLIFNEVEHDEDKLPPSDVWLARHTQQGYNVSRQGLKEHRKQNRPFYVSAAGVLEDEDKEKLANHDSGELIEILGLQPGQDIAKLIQAFHGAPITKELYDVEMYFQDLQRVVGTQEANLGQPSTATATQSSIVETSRQTTIGDNVDDLDEMLSQLAKATGQLMLLEMTKDKVIEIVGPGAVWPDLPQSRQAIAKEIELDIKAGSSGKPNVQIEFQNLEKAWPILQLLPGFNPAPLVEKVCSLLDIDLEAAVAEGMPSVQAMNAMQQKMMLGGGPAGPTGASQIPPGAPGGGAGAGGPPPPPGATGTSPAQQGAHGGHNDPRQRDLPGGRSQMYPAPRMNGTGAPMPPNPTPQ